MMRRLTCLVASLLMAGSLVAVSGCGEESGGGTNEPEKTAETSGEEAPADKPKQKSYRERVAGCVEDVGFTTRNAGNALRVETPGGTAIANIQTFATEAEARKFHSELLVEGDGGGKGVAVFLQPRSDADKRVVGDCLTP